MSIRILSALALLSYSIAASVAVAQEQPPFVGSVDIASAKITKVRELRRVLYGEFDGVWGVFAAPQGKTFLILNLELKPTFDKTVDGEELVNAQPEAISLEVKDAKPVWPIGMCNPHGTFDAYPSGYYAYPTGQGRNFGYDPVFVVAEDATEAKLTLGGTTHQLTLPDEVERTTDPAKAVQVKVDAVRLESSVQRLQELGTYEHAEGEFAETLVSSAGRFALVSIVLKPKVRNQQLGYGVDKSAFGLRLGKEVYVGAVGFLNDETFSLSADGFYFEQDALGEFNAGQATIVFPLPGAVSKGKLLYLGSPVADVEFGG